MTIIVIGHDDNPGYISVYRVERELARRADAAASSPRIPNSSYERSVPSVTECTEPDFSTRVRRAKTLEVRCWTFTAGWVSPCAWRQHSRELRPPAHASTRSVRIPPAPPAPAGRTARIPPPGSWHPSLHAPPFALRVAVAGRVARQVIVVHLVGLVSGSRALGRFVPMQYSAVPRYRLFAARIALSRSMASYLARSLTRRAQG